MFILVCPISGAKFCNQITAVLHLTEIKFVPDITLCSSGGNISSYLLSCANWDRNKLIKMCHTINSHLFIKKWCYSDTISLLIGFFRGTMYNRGIGCHEWFLDFFTDETIQKDEIWTGTYNKKLQKACLFTNKAESKFIDKNKFYMGLNQCMPLQFAAGDMCLISKAIIGSMSIPGYIPEQIINDDPHIDGGVSCSSPLIFLSDTIMDYFHQHEKDGEKLNIVYITPFNCYNSDDENYINFLDNIKQTTNNFMRSHSILDKIIAYNMIKINKREIREHSFKCTLGNLERIKKIWTIVSKSMLEIYPIDDFTMDITNFSGEELVETVEKSYGHLFCKFWYVEPEMDEHYDSIINTIEIILKFCEDQPDVSETCETCD